MPLAAALFLRLVKYSRLVVEKLLLKWGGAGFAALAAVLAGVVKLHARSAPAVTLNVAGTKEQIRRGKATAGTFCSACHSKTDTMSDDDVWAVIALLRSLPAAGQATPESRPII